jgi:hypothetical protein
VLKKHSEFKLKKRKQRRSFLNGSKYQTYYCHPHHGYWTNLSSAPAKAHQPLAKNYPKTTTALHYTKFKSPIFASYWSRSTQHDMDRGVFLWMFVQVSQRISSTVHTLWGRGPGGNPIKAGAHQLDVSPSGALMVSVVPPQTDPPPSKFDPLKELFNFSGMIESISTPISYPFKSVY